jgi:hypothetical protein
MCTLLRRELVQVAVALHPASPVVDPAVLVCLTSMLVGALHRRLRWKRLDADNFKFMIM